MTKQNQTTYQAVSSNLSPLTIQAAITNKAVIQRQMNKLVKDYRLAKWAAKSAHARKDFKAWNEYMRLTSRLKKRLKITADWLHLSIYGYEVSDR